MQSAWGDQATEFFFKLTPDKVLDAVESFGFQCTGRCSTLNSMENRVYEVEIEWEEDQPPRSPSERFRVAKFYRPGRWSREQILEEHEFLLTLIDQEIPAIAPCVIEGETLKKTADGIWYALFPKVGGRSPSEFSDEQLERVGRLLARIHNVGAAREAAHRIILGPDTYARSALEFLLKNDFLPLALKSRYETVVSQICDHVDPWFAKVKPQRIHGDCHMGNLLWNDSGPFFLDFDDMVRGPCIQDLWMIVPGREPQDQENFRTLLAAYEQMREFDHTTLRLVEPLRTLRMIHFNGWIARRWEDPAFPQNIPHFGTEKYWQTQVQDLEEQWRLIQTL